MITSLVGHASLSVFHQAIRIKGNSLKRDVFDHFDASQLTDNQKNALRILLNKADEYPPSSPMAGDGLLLGILFMSLRDAGVRGIPELTKAQREFIFNGIVTVCKNVINAESQRLASIGGLNTNLPSDWNV